MTATMPVPQAHKIGAAVMLTSADITREIKEIEHKVGSREDLERKNNLIGLTLEERIALNKLDNLDYLLGVNEH